MAAGALAFTCLALAPPAWGQGPDEPAFYAIQNATLVTVSGRTIPNGTIVLEDGLIAAIGANVDVPAGARVIDGTGLTVYPGLINALSTIGLAEIESSGSNGGSAVPLGPDDRPAATPWLSAADHLDAGASAIETWRQAGITTVVVAPDAGIVTGQAAVINLAGSDAREMVIRPHAALRLNLGSVGGFVSFPGSLMGVLAYIKQLSYDTDHYRAIWSRYESSPRGMERPRYDRTLASLAQVAEANELVLIPGAWAKEIQRAIRLGDEINANTVVYGGHQAYAVSDELSTAGTSVLVNVDWPKAPEDADPEADTPLRELRLRAAAPSTPMVLNDASVPFAFYSGDLKGPGDFIANIGKSVEAGLPSDAALRALTLGAAEIFGVGDRLGSLEEGKIANLVVTDGDLFAKDTKARMVFVDGRLYENPQPEPVAAEEDAEEPEEDAAVEETEEEQPRPAPKLIARDPAPTAPRVTVIQNATVLTVTQGTIENGSILIRDGVIAEIGQDVDVPSGAHVIDATGQFVMPGIIDAHSHIAIDGGVNECSAAITSMVGIEDVVNPDDIDIYRGLAGGLTTANLLHGSCNPIGGKNAVIKLRWGKDADDLLMDEAVPGIKFALGENVKRSNFNLPGQPSRYPGTRMGVMDVIREGFTRAQEYQQEWADYEQRRRRDRNAVPPRRDLELEALVEIMNGERQVHAHSYRADEILQLMRVAEEFGFRIAAFQHVLEGYKVADELAAHGAGASTFSDWWSYKVEAYDAIPHNAALMTERGVVVSINSDSQEEDRHLNQEAAKSMRWGGLSEEEALSLVTINPAIQLGVSEHIGSIEVGKHADLAIYDRHPLSAYAVVQKTLIDGAVYFDIEEDKARQEAIEAEKKALEEEDEDEEEKKTVTAAATGVGGGR
jgi:imidazolonepropionase-like amidohydrolase